MNFDHLKARLVHPTDSREEWEYLVHETSKLIGRSFIQTHKLVEDWPISKLRDRLNEAQKHHGEMKPVVYWWWKRKVDLSTAKAFDKA